MEDARNPQNDRELLLEIHQDVKGLKDEFKDFRKMREDINLWKKLTQAIFWLIGVTGAALGIFIDWKDIIK